jgi:polyferredoxin
MYNALADIVVAIHLFFIAFALFGELLVMWRRWIAWVHIPSIAWIAFNQFVGWHCPLTNLEKWLRHKGSGQGYNGGVIEHYILPVIGKEPHFVDVLGGPVLVIVFVGYYWWVFRRYGKAARERRSVTESAET